MRNFGTTHDGQTVHAIDLRAHGLALTLLTRGAIVQDLRLDGVGHSLTLGSDDLADYEGKMRNNGALIGPVANRIAGAAATIDGKLHRFDANQQGKHTLHSGADATHLMIWQVAETGEDHATLRLDLPDGHGGFPGNRRVTARYTITAPCTLRLEVSATTDAPTLMNFASHCYWNLDGTDSWEGHRMRVVADALLPTDADTIPTGEVATVAGTAFDFRTERPVTPGAPALDTNFCLSDGRVPLRDVLWLTGKSGTSMTLATTEPGLQVYDGRAPLRPGDRPYFGLAIEPQFWPDAPHHPGFPSIEVGPDETYRQVSEWRFSRG